MILEAVENHNSSIEIGEATVQVLELEDKIKAATLWFIIDNKVSSSVRNLYSEDMLHVSKLAKKVIELKKRPVDKDNLIDRNKEKISAKKAARSNKRKENMSIDIKELENE